MRFIDEPRSCRGSGASGTKAAAGRGLRMGGTDEAPSRILPPWSPAGLPGSAQPVFALRFSAALAVGLADVGLADIGLAHGSACRWAALPRPAVLGHQRPPRL